MIGTGGAPGADAGADADGGVVGTGPCATFCAAATNVIDFMVSGSFQSGPVGALEVCYETTSAVVQANCSNFTSRTLTVNTAAETCNNLNFTLPARVNGGYCFHISAGSPSTASFSVF
jgi:hypothetical protein